MPHLDRFVERLVRRGEVLATIVGSSMPSRRVIDEETASVRRVLVGR